jgi:hypothetical protein
MRVASNWGSYKDMLMVCLKLRPQYLATSLARQSRSQWPRGINRGSAAVLLLGMRVRIRLGSWMFVPCECCVLSVRRADHSSRGVLPSVVCLSVIM